MGGASRDEVPRRRVRISEPFWLARTEVTVRQWRTFATACAAATVQAPGKEDNAPALASHEDAWQFCNFYGYILPTEAQWEWACRAGDDTLPTRIDLQAMQDAAWYHHNAGRHPMPTGTKAANAFGLHDMLGNVWEWCSDWYGPYANNKDMDVDPAGPTAGSRRVLRGGSWFSLPPALPSTRGQDHPSARTAHYGFRPACHRSLFGK